MPVITRWIVGALLMLSCGSQPVCSSENCAGCCSATRVCEPGRSTSACGSDGVTCSVCTGAQICGSIGCELPILPGGAGGGRQPSGYPPAPSTKPDVSIAGGTCNGAYCNCDGNSSCTADCGAADSCSIDCNTNPDWCQASCEGNCYLDCNSAHGCAANCGANCYVDCNSQRGNCTAIVGDGSLVDCYSVEEACTIECLGSCSVDCGNADSCSVRCDAGPDGGCDVSCTTGHGKLCPDGKTKVCGATPCP